MKTEISLFKIEKGEISKPLTKLIEVISNGTGTWYEPKKIIKKAAAEAIASKIKAQNDIEITELKIRALARLEEVEIRRQKNLEQIASQAARYLPENVSDKKVSDDWSIQYFNYAQDVSDEEMQKIWAKLLAEEVAAPGAYSKRTLNTLSLLDKADAENFSKVCNLLFRDPSDRPFLIAEPATSAMVTELLGPGDYLNHFVSIGLLMPEFIMVEDTELCGKGLSYHSKRYLVKSLDTPPVPGAYPALKLNTYFRFLSFIGEQIAKLADVKPVENYVENVFTQIEAKLKVKFIEF